VYVRLLGEGTSVFRPAPARRIAEGVVQLLAPDGFDPDDEDWEFAPGSVVQVEERELEGEDVLLAVRMVDQAGSP